MANIGKGILRRRSLESVPLTTTTHVGVSFARTPLADISAKVEAIKALGWREGEDGRGDPWAATFVKDMPDDDNDPAAELRAVMGDYWLDADAITGLLASRTQMRAVDSEIPSFDELVDLLRERLRDADVIQAIRVTQLQGV
jgi:hypothetical protein